MGRQGRGRKSRVLTQRLPANGTQCCFKCGSFSTESCRGSFCPIQRRRQHQPSLLEGLPRKEQDTPYNAPYNTPYPSHPQSPTSFAPPSRGDHVSPSERGRSSYPSTVGSTRARRGSLAGVTGEEQRKRRMKRRRRRARDGAGSSCAALLLSGPMRLEQGTRAGGSDDTPPAAAAASAGVSLLSPPLPLLHHHEAAQPHPRNSNPSPPPSPPP